MVKCTACGGHIIGKSIMEELASGRLVRFCCHGCMRLYEMVNNRTTKNIRLGGLHG